MLADVQGKQVNCDPSMLDVMPPENLAARPEAALKACPRLDAKADKAAQGLHLCVVGQPLAHTPSSQTAWQTQRVAVVQKWRDFDDLGTRVQHYIPCIGFLRYIVQVGQGCRQCTSCLLMPSQLACLQNIPLEQIPSCPSPDQNHASRHCPKGCVSCSARLLHAHQCLEAHTRRCSIHPCCSKDFEAYATCQGIKQCPLKHGHLCTRIHKTGELGGPGVCDVCGQALACLS